MERTLVSGIRRVSERKVNDLRDFASPSEIRVYDLQGNLKRVEPAPTEPKYNFVGRIKE